MTVTSAKNCNSNVTFIKRHWKKKLISGGRGPNQWNHYEIMQTSGASETMVRTNWSPLSSLERRLNQPLLSSIKGTKVLLLLSSVVFIFLTRVLFPLFFIVALSLSPYFCNSSTGQYYCMRNERPYEWKLRHCSLVLAGWHPWTTKTNCIMNFLFGNQSNWTELNWTEFEFLFFSTSLRPFFFCQSPSF